MYRRQMVHDLIEDRYTLEVVEDGGTWRTDSHGLETGMHGVERYSHRGNDYSSVRGETEWVVDMRRGDWSIRTTTRTVMTADAEAFHIDAELVAYEDETEVFRRTWERRIPRRLV
jgi:hypothetical protein